MNEVCKTCNHRKISEGGCYDVFEYPNIITNFQIGKAHPCHENSKLPCRGHLRDIKMVENEIGHYHGDCINVKYTVRLTLEERS